MNSFSVFVAFIFSVLTISIMDVIGAFLFVFEPISFSIGGVFSLFTLLAAFFYLLRKNVYFPSVLLILSASFYMLILMIIYMYVVLPLASPWGGALYVGVAPVLASVLGFGVIFFRFKEALIYGVMGLSVWLYPKDGTDAVVYGIYSCTVLGFSLIHLWVACWHLKYPRKEPKKCVP